MSAGRGANRNGVALEVLRLPGPGGASRTTTAARPRRAARTLSTVAPGMPVTS